MLLKVVPGNRGTMFPSNHASAWGARCRTIPRLWTMMYMYYNGLLNGFWADCNDRRSGPMASPSSGPSFRWENWAHRPCCKAGVQGLRPKWAWRALCRTLAPPWFMPNSWGWIKDSKRQILRSLTGWYWTIERLINAPLKGALYVTIGSTVIIA